MNDYRVLSRFECYGKNMVTVKFNNAVHVMAVEDLQKIKNDLYFRQQKKQHKVKSIA